MNKSIVVISKIILVLALLNIFAFSVRHVVLGGERFGLLTNPFLHFIEFPTVVKRAVEEIQESPYHVAVDTTFKNVNLLETDIFALNARSEKGLYVYELSNLKSDSVIYSWTFSFEDFTGSYRNFPVAHPQNPILLSDSSIIGMLYGTTNLFRIDKKSNIVWKNTSNTFHHSLNLSHDHYLWACGWMYTYTKNEHSNSFTKFRDDVLLKVDIESGEVVLKKSLAKIFVENGYFNMVHGYGNEESSKGYDLFHLNDIQPITIDGDYWQKGDLLLSLRHRSTIVHYRPETNKIIRLISGPFLSQHDVDVISGHEISIFNNNRTVTHNSDNIENNVLSNGPVLELKSSNVVVYDFSDSSFTYPFLEVFEKENIYTPKQGLHEFLKNGDVFVESTDVGKIYIIRDNEIIFKKYANAEDDSEYTEYPHWMRIYENLNFLK